jgi:hypothetical protein
MAPSFYSMGAALGRTAMYVNNVSGVEENSCPYPPKAYGIVTVGRHEKSLEGTQASHEAE